jgi:hypothetical protein
MTKVTGLLPKIVIKRGHDFFVIAPFLLVTSKVMLPKLVNVFLVLASTA